MTTKNIEQFIKEHNEFPLNKKIWIKTYNST